MDHVGARPASEGEPVMIPDYTPVAEDVHSVVLAAKAANEGRPVAMVGHSMGGMIAVRYAELYPGEVAALVLSGPVIGTWKPATDMLAGDVIPSDPLDITTLSRDDEIGRIYDEDPYVWHGPFRRRTLVGIYDCLLDIALDSDKRDRAGCWQHGEADGWSAWTRAARDGDAAQRRRDRDHLPGRAPRDLQRDQQGRGAGRHHGVPADQGALTRPVVRG